MKKVKKRWNVCPTCFQLVYATGHGIGNHKCPTEVKARMDAELDMAVAEELTTWDEDLKRFWNSKDVKFYEYLANRKQI